MHENFRGTEGAVGLTRWFEKLESQFRISNVVEGDRVKFASSTLLDGALAWWNVYVCIVTLDTAHATSWSDFKTMFIRKYCPRNEIKQMENELWNLKVKGTNLQNLTSCHFHVPRTHTLYALNWYQRYPVLELYIEVIEGEGDAATKLTSDKRDEEFTEIENNKELADIKHTFSVKGIEVDHDKVKVIAKLPHPTNCERMSRIFEASLARGICPSITRASQSSASFGNPDIQVSYH
ncbi:reverse transcriptase domain-containing protein [Tanacetum coccineum]